MALDLTTAIAPDLAGRVLASILVSIAMCAGGTVALLAWSRRPTIPVAATRRTLSGDSSTVARRKPSIDDQRGACHRARIIAPQPCMRLVHKDLTMMQSCASAAKLRGGGPILRNGATPWSASGDRHLGSSSETNDILFARLQELPELVLPASSRHAARKTTPAGTSPVVTIRHSAMSSFLASATIRVLRVPPRASAVRARYHWANALSFWCSRKRQASWIIPRRTRALPALASPFSRRLRPLSSGAPVRPA